MTDFLRNQFERKGEQYLLWTGDGSILSKWVWGPWPWIVREIYSDYSCECARVQWPGLRRRGRGETNIITTNTGESCGQQFGCHHNNAKQSVSFKLDAKSLEFLICSRSSNITWCMITVTVITPELLCHSVYPQSLSLVLLLTFCHPNYHHRPSVLTRF